MLKIILQQQTMAQLVQIIKTSDFLAPSPDPSGIVYISHLGNLFLADGEVDEIDNLFKGKNLFETTLKGNYVSSNLTGIDFTQEATGIAYNPQNRFLYISDDDRSRIYQVDPGKDGKYSTSDDVVSYFSTKLGSVSKSDSEDVAFSTKTGNLWVVDGLNAEVYQYTTGGQLISQFDTAKLGLLDPEGIAEDPTTGNVFVVGRPQIEGGQKVYYVFEVTSSGNLVRKIDISAANPNKPAGLTIAPNSQDPSKRSLYIVDRGDDNDDEPDENDGRIYEFLLDSNGGGGGGNPPPSQNQAPSVSAGLNQVVLYKANLDGTVVDDGLPKPGSVTTTWSKLSGSGNVTFGNSKAEDTTANFSVPGDYVLQLSASDGQLTGSSQTNIRVLDPKHTIFVTSTKESETAGGVDFTKQDILAYDNVKNSWSKYFDGSALGLSDNIKLRDFHINDDGSILLAINNPATLPGELKVDDSDVVKFIPTSTGENTSGKFELYFDGSDVGLDTSSEELDGIAFAPNGGLVISTSGSFKVPGSNGDLTGADEDLLLFTPSSTGDNTVGTWTLLFDGSDVGLSSSSEDVDGIWLEYGPNNVIKSIYLTTEGDFSVPGVNASVVTGKGGDILRFNPTSLGFDTQGTFELLPWDKSSNGIASAGLTIEGIAVASGFQGL
ncbi:MAG: hypothetical protein RMY34_05450 [Aulosira sp. DedQUE10]|nr:hypothetical protein [Aulosira sp. DedQUE10]